MAYEEFRSAEVLKHPTAVEHVLRVRTALVAQLLRQARKELAIQNPKGAKPLYEHVLALEPSNDAARLEIQRAKALVDATSR